METELVFGIIFHGLGGYERVVNMGLGGEVEKGE